MPQPKKDKSTNTHTEGHHTAVRIQGENNVAQCVSQAHHGPLKTMQKAWGVFFFLHAFRTQFFKPPPKIIWAHFFFSFGQDSANNINQERYSVEQQLPLPLWIRSMYVVKYTSNSSVKLRPLKRTCGHCEWSTIWRQLFREGSLRLDNVKVGSKISMSLYATKQQQPFNLMTNSEWTTCIERKGEFDIFGSTQLWALKWRDFFFKFFLWRCVSGLDFSFSGSKVPHDNEIKKRWTGKRQIVYWPPTAMSWVKNLLFGRPFRIGRRKKRNIAIPVVRVTPIRVDKKMIVKTLLGYAWRVIKSQ
jgi:hypothetical protein